MHLNRIPVPRFVPCISVKSSMYDDLLVRDNLASNPSHPSVIVTDTNHSSYANREETLPNQQPSLDFSFEDYFSNFFRDTVADEQTESSYHFMNTVDAPGRDAWQDFSNYYTLPRWQLPGVPTDWGRYDDLTWQAAGGWHRETRAQWRHGHVKSEAPKEIQIVGGAGGGHHGEDYSLDWKSDDDIYLRAERRPDYGVIGELPPKRRGNLPNEQDQGPRQLEPLTTQTYERSFYETQPVTSRPTSTDFVVDLPLAESIGAFNVPHSGTKPKYPVQRSSMEINHEFYSYTPPSTRTPRTPPNYPVYADPPVSTYIRHTPFSIPRRTSYSPKVIDRNRKYSHNPTRITTPAPLEGTYQPLPDLPPHDPYLAPQQEVHDAAVHAPRIRRLIGFLFMTTEQKVGEIERLIRSMRPRRTR